MKIENVDTQHRLKLTVEDSVNRFNFEFVRPTNDGNNGDIVYAQGVKGMMTKGPELKVEIVPSQSDEADFHRQNKGISRKEERIQRRYTCK